MKCFKERQTTNTLNKCESMDVEQSIENLHERNKSLKELGEIRNFDERFVAGNEMKCNVLRERW